MAVTLTFDTQLSRVRVEADTLGVLASYAIVDRSTDGINWTVIRGGSQFPVTGEALDRPIDDYEWPDRELITYRVRSFSVSDVLQDMQTNTITPELDATWIKSIARPFLNIPVLMADYSQIERPGRVGVFEIVGRSFPVAVTDIGGSQRYTLMLRTSTHEERSHLELLVNSGDVIFLHVAEDDCAVAPETMYAVVQNTTTSRAGHSELRHVSVQLAEVAAPDPAVVPTVGTWQSVLNAYATWQDLINDQPTWQDVLELVGKPADVIVP